MNAKTKIYATIGPASYHTELLVKMINKGMDGIRINLSHGNIDKYEKWFNNLRQAEKTTGKSVSVLADIQGTEIRTGLLPDKTIALHTGNEITILPVSSKNNKSAKKSGVHNRKIYVNYPELANVLKPEQIVLIDDGLIKLKVRKIKNNKITCHILRGGLLGEKKGVNLPGITLKLPVLRNKDKKDIINGIQLGIDYLMVPFTRSRADVNLIRNFLDSNNGNKVGILAKIENQEGIDNIHHYIKHVEGIILARGDLGVEIGLAKVPLVQKKIINICRSYNKKAIVATDMLKTMTTSPLPSRAEVSDNANAVLDGSTGIMVTGETAVGKYPVEVIDMLSEIIKETEKNI